MDRSPAAGAEDRVGPADKADKADKADPEGRVGQADGLRCRR